MLLHSVSDNQIHMMRWFDIYYFHTGIFDKLCLQLITTASSVQISQSTADV